MKCKYCGNDEPWWYMIQTKFICWFCQDKLGITAQQQQDAVFLAKSKKSEAYWAERAKHEITEPQAVRYMTNNPNQKAIYTQKQAEEAGIGRTDQWDKTREKK